LNPTSDKTRRLVPASLWWSLLVLGVFLAWSNIYQVPFLYDDSANIVESRSIRHLWPLADVLFPPLGSSVGGRPLFNLSFALNYAVSGLDVWSFHLFNILVHSLSVVVLFGFLCRTLLLPPLRARFGARAGLLAFFTALVWAVHPLHTDAVTYISQRAEAMMGLFFLTSAWLALRGWEARRPHGWHALSVLAFIAGVGCKEVIVALPPVLLAFEWTFFGRGPWKAVRRSPVLYAGHALGLFLLALLVRWGATAQVTPQATATPLSYLATQAQVIVHYLRTAFWPSGLCLDYGWPVISFREALPYGAVVACLLALSVALLARRRPSGFLGAWFFFILAPTSSIMPLPFLAWDRRMYLPLAAVVVLVIAGGYRAGVLALGKWRPGAGLRRAAGLGGVFLVLATALALGTVTWVRNLDYATGVSIWQDVVENRPDAPRGYSCLSSALLKEGRALEAEQAARTALALDHEYTDALGNLALALQARGENEEAQEALDKAVERLPFNFLAHYSLGTILLEKGGLEGAMEHFQAAALIRAERWEPVNGMGLVREKMRQYKEAEASFQRAADLDPEAWEPVANLGRALAAQGRHEAAILPFSRALAMAPDVPGLNRDLGEAFLALGRHLQAEARLRRAAWMLRTPRVFSNLGAAILAQGRREEAARWFTRALALDPAYQPARRNLAGMGMEPVPSPP